MKRPSLLTVLCILSFIGSGAGLFTYSVVSFSYQEFMAALDEVQLDLPGMELIRTASKGFFISGTLLFAASFYGVLKMWKMKKVGFHFYTIAQVLLVIHPLMYLDAQGFPWMQLILTFSFILLYGLHLKNMS